MLFHLQIYSKKTYKANDMKIKRPEEFKIRPKVAEVVKHMKKGDKVLFEAAKDGSLSAARTAVSRANAKLGPQEYSVPSEDNGVTFIIEREAGLR